MERRRSGLTRFDGTLAWLLRARGRSLATAEAPPGLVGYSSRTATTAPWFDGPSCLHPHACRIERFVPSFRPGLRAPVMR